MEGSVMTGGLVDIPHAVLASLLEAVNESEGVLICRNEIETSWDESQVGRAFAIYQFNLFQGNSGDGELTFSHEESGTSLTYTGTAVTIAFGGHITEALSDLLQALYQLQWRNIDVYTNNEEFFDDLARCMPASVDIDLERCDVPVDLSEDLTAFSAAVAANAYSAESNVDEFNRVFAASEGVAPPPAPSVVSAPAQPAISAAPGMGVGVGVKHNYIPDESDLALPVPGLVSAGGDDEAFAEPHAAAPLVVAPGAARRAFSLSSPSPVAEPVVGAAPVAEAPVSAPISPVPEAPLQGVVPAVAPAARVGEDGINAVAVVEAAIAAPPVHVAPVVADESVSSAAQVDVAPWVMESWVSGPIRIGDAVVVLDSSLRPLSDAQLEELRTEGGRQRKVVRIEPGASVVTGEHVFWSPGAEVSFLRSDEEDGNLAVLRGLVASLWPNGARDHLVTLALLVLLDVEDDCSPAGSLGALLNLAQQGMDSVLARLEDSRRSSRLLDRLVPMVRDSGSAASLGRLVGDLWAVPLMGWAAAYAGGDSPPLSFAQVARGGDERIFVVTVDAMEEAGVEVFVVGGLMRWVARLAHSRRVKPVAAAVESAAVQEAAKMLEQLPPEMVAAMKAVLSLKN